MPEMFLERYAKFFEKLNKLCKWEISKLANLHIFIIFLWKSLSIAFTWYLTYENGMSISFWGS